MCDCSLFCKNCQREAEMYVSKEGVFSSNTPITDSGVQRLFQNESMTSKSLLISVQVKSSQFKPGNSVVSTTSPSRNGNSGSDKKSDPHIMSIQAV